MGSGEAVGAGESVGAIVATGSEESVEAGVTEDSAPKQPTQRSASDNASAPNFIFFSNRFALISNHAFHLFILTHFIFSPFAVMPGFFPFMTIFTTSGEIKTANR